MRIRIECYHRDRIAHGDGWSGADNKKGNPISEISFFDSGSFARTQVLELVVQGNSPGVIRINAVGAFSVSSECIFSVQLYVLLEGYVSDSIPESQVISIEVASGEVLEHIIVPGAATEVNIIVYIIVSNGQIPSASFLPVRFAIGQACVPSGVIFVSSIGVLPVFTEYVELDRKSVV